MTREADAYSDGETVDVSVSDWTPKKANAATAALLVDRSTGAAGDVRVQFKSGAIVTIRDVPSGTLLPIAVTKVFSEGTTDDRITAFYW